MPLNLNASFANELGDTARVRFNGGVMEFRTGSKPGPGGSATGTLLASGNIPSGYFAAATNGAITGSVTMNIAVTTTGQPGYVRMVSGNAVVHMDVTDENGAGPVLIDTGGAGLAGFNLDEGGIVKVLSTTLTFPMGT